MTRARTAPAMAYPVNLRCQPEPCQCDCSPGQHRPRCRHETREHPGMPPSGKCKGPMGHALEQAQGAALSVSTVGFERLQRLVRAMLFLGRHCIHQPGAAVNVHSQMVVAGVATQVNFVRTKNTGLPPGARTDLTTATKASLSRQTSTTSLGFDSPGWARQEPEQESSDKLQWSIP